MASSGQAASGLGSFAGALTGSAFSASAGQRFLGRFRTYKDDGLFHRDGLARVVVKPSSICDGGSDELPATIVNPCGTFDSGTPVEPASGNGAPTDTGTLPPPPDRPEAATEPFLILFGTGSTLGLSTSDPRAQFGLAGDLDPSGSILTTPSMCAQIFEIYKTATLSNIILRVTGSPILPAIGHFLQVDVVPVVDQQFVDPDYGWKTTIINPASGSLASVTVDAGSLVLSFSSPSTITFGPNVLNPGKYALVFRELGDSSDTSPAINTSYFQILSLSKFHPIASSAVASGEAYYTLKDDAYRIVYFNQRGTSLIGPPVPETLESFSLQPSDYDSSNLAEVNKAKLIQDVIHTTKEMALRMSFIPPP
jgi:hypothetical protein